MDNYTIYCTQEQVKKAIELGAPIVYSNTFTQHSTIEALTDKGYAIIPTAEQMIGWLETRKIFIYIMPCYGTSCSWYIASKGYNEYGYTSKITVCKTRKEATLAAIDAALEYLSNMNRKTKGL